MELYEETHDKNNLGKSYRVYALQKLMTFDIQVAQTMQQLEIQLGTQASKFNLPIYGM